MVSPGSLDPKLWLLEALLDKWLITLSACAAEALTRHRSVWIPSDPGPLVRSVATSPPDPSLLPTLGRVQSPQLPPVELDYLNSWSSRIFDYGVFSYVLTLNPLKNPVSILVAILWARK